MKKQSNQKDNSLENVLNESFAQEEQKIKINAQSLGERNLPKPIGESVATYFEEHNFQYQKFVNTINNELQIQTVRHQIVEEERASNDKIKRLKNDMDELEGQGIPINAELKTLPPSPSKFKTILVRAAIFIVALFEGVLSIPVFEVWGFSLIESILLGALFAGVLAVLAHLVEWLILLGKTITQKKIIAFIILLFMGLLFYYMADARAEYLSSEASGNENDLFIHFSPVPFVFISLLLFIAAVGLCVFYLPSKQERELMKAKARLLQSKKDIGDKIQAKKSAVARIKAELAQLKRESASVLVNGCMLEELVINNAKSGFALWKRQNLMHRQDNLTPDSFTEQYPFTFTTYFHSIKKLSDNEND